MGARQPAAASLWSAQGEVPRNLADADVRAKEIRFSSRTRAGTDLYKHAQKLRIAFATLLERLPDELRGLPEVAQLAAEANDRVCNIVHLIYRSKKYEGSAKDSSSPGARWKSTGSPDTAMPSAP